MSLRYPHPNSWNYRIRMWLTIRIVELCRDQAEHEAITSRGTWPKLAAKCTRFLDWARKQ